MLKKIAVFVLGLSLFSSHLAFAAKPQMMKNPLSVHILNLQTGQPVDGVKVILEKQDGEKWQYLASNETDQAGRITALYPTGKKLEKGIYRVVFQTGDYFKKQQLNTFFPEIPVLFNIDNISEHYHVPLLLSQYGFSTYKGN